MKKKIRDDGVHYNRKFNRWELWAGGQMIFYRNISEDENHKDSYNEAIRQITDLYGLMTVYPNAEPVKKMIRKEFKGSMLVTVSDNEVKLWVCNDEGQNIFRFKAVGEVHQGGNDIIVVAKQEK